MKQFLLALRDLFTGGVPPLPAVADLEKLSEPIEPILFDTPLDLEQQQTIRTLISRIPAASKMNVDSVGDVTVIWHYPECDLVMLFLYRNSASVSIRTEKGTLCISQELLPEFAEARERLAMAKDLSLCARIVKATE